MAKKAAKQQPPHLRIRIEPKLLSRLERAREANGNTLTGEIVERLEGTFSTEDKMELFKQIQERRIEDVRQSIKDNRDTMEREQREWATETLAIREEIIKQKLEDQKKIERLEESLNREIAIVDTLLGDDPAAKEAIRAVALLLATNPAASAAIKAAAEKEIKQ
jgi:hypothetical protein